MKLFAALLGLVFLGALMVPRNSQEPAGHIPRAQAGGMVAPAAFPPPVRYGAFSLARPPSFRYGIAVGQRDRQAAQEMAEAGCRASSRGCSQIIEFTDPCIAVTEAVRRVALVMTSDPRTYEMRGIDYGTASNPADAQEAAMQACRARERGALTCRVVQSVCGPR